MNSCLKNVLTLLKIAVHGKVYDVSHFHNKHPGEGINDQYIALHGGTDVTVQPSPIIPVLTWHRSYSKSTIPRTKPSNGLLNLRKDNSLRSSLLVCWPASYRAFRSSCLLENMEQTLSLIQVR